MASSNPLIHQSQFTDEELSNTGHSESDAQEVFEFNDVSYTILVAD